jgi:uncharacterized protein YjiS (DUF1127 family)
MTVTTFHHRLAPVGRRRLVAWLTRRRRRESRAGLAWLDERLLRDIGLTPSQADKLSR